MKAAFWVVWIIAIGSFFLWRSPQYAGPAGMACIVSIIAALALLALRR